MHNLSKAGMLICTLLFMTYAGNTQVRTKSFHAGVPDDLKPSKGMTVEAFNVSNPKKFDSLSKQVTTKGKDYSDRFAVAESVDINVLQNSKVVTNGNTITYYFKLKAGSAKNLSLHFGRFFLSPNANLSIHSDVELTESITSSQNNPDSIWATRVYQGNVLHLILTMPIAEKANNSLTIKQINYGYKKVGADFYGNLGASAGCNINVACPTANGWTEEANSVCLITVGGEEKATGTMVMNACGTNRPFLLTAFHFAGSSFSNWVFQFQYWSTACLSNTGYNEDIQYNGATRRAASVETDFLLLELNTTPASNSNIRYAGWSRSSTAATSATSLHHPKGDVMKYSHSSSAVSAYRYFTTESYWKANFSEGLVQYGSSGAPLFDQNHRVVGQLRTNPENTCSGSDGDNCWCNQTQAGIYGRFDLSWTGGGTSSTQLSYWLDPYNAGTITTTNTTNIANLIPWTGLVITGASDFCSGSSPYSLNVPAGVTVSWQTSSPYLATAPLTGNPIDVTKTGDGLVTLTATVSVCNTTFSASKQIGLGVPTVDGVTFTNGANGQGYFCTSHSGNQFEPILPFAPNNSSIQYRLLSWPSLTVVYTDPISHSTGGPIPVGSNFAPGWYVLEIKVNTACGSSEWMGFEVEFVDCSQMENTEYFRVQASPNPTSSDLYVTIEDKKDEVKALKASEKVGFILYDFKKAKAVKQWRYNNDQKQYKLNVADIAPGQYVLLVTKGKYRQSTQIIIQ